MSIERTKEQIAAMPKDTYVAPVTHDGGRYHINYEYYISDADLKELAASHTALLEGTATKEVENVQ